MNAFLSRDITWRPASRKQKQMRNSVRDLLRGMPLTQCFIHYILCTSREDDHVAVENKHGLAIRESAEQTVCPQA